MNRLFTSTVYWSFALERGDWDVTWYCTDCYMRYYICSYRAVCHRLGFHDRALQKAATRRRRYALPQPEENAHVAAVRCRRP